MEAQQDVAQLRVGATMYEKQRATLSGTALNCVEEKDTPSLQHITVMVRSCMQDLAYKAALKALQEEIALPFLECRLAGPLDCVRVSTPCLVPLPTNQETEQYTTSGMGTAGSRKWRAVSTCAMQ
jgi:hypothetical protein